jgi:hypothetical protein
MASIGNLVFDSGLDFLDTDGDEIHICSQEPTTYAEATSTYSLGSATPVIAAPSDASGGGRECVVAAITDGSVTDSDDASHIAIVDVSGTVLLVTGALSAPQGVTSGNTWTLTEFAVTIPDPA